MHRLILLITFFVGTLTAAPVPVPSIFKVCSRSDSNFNECLKTAIQAALKDLAPGLKTPIVDPIDPLLIKELSINQGSSSVAINLELKNAQVHGISKGTADYVDAKLDGDEKTLEIRLSSKDVLDIDAKYTVDGKVLILPIKGTGDAKLQLSDIEATILLKGKTVVKNGVEYLGFTEAKLSLDPKNVTIHLDNLFNGDKALGDNMNKFLNENWQDVYKDLKGEFEKNLGIRIIETVNSIFTKVDFNRAFPK